MELNEKLSPVAKEMYQRMLGIVELPDFLLLEYFNVKKLIDKVDGVLSPFDLVQIALRCGFDVETMTFQRITAIAPEMQAKIDELDVQPPTMPQVETDPADAPVVEETPEPKAKKPAPEPVTGLSMGQEVEIFLDDEIVKGVIVGLPKKGSDVYDVESGGKVYKMPEMEIDT
jgi:hypothetical protein